MLRYSRLIYRKGAGHISELSTAAAHQIEAENIRGGRTVMLLGSAYWAWPVRFSLVCVCWQVAGGVIFMTPFMFGVKLDPNSWNNFDTSLAKILNL